MGLIEYFKDKYNVFDFSNFVWSYELAIGKLDGMKLIRPKGRNVDVDANEDIWNGGGAYTGFPATAGTVSVSSLSALDTIVGTGARQVLIKGVDANWQEIEETLNLNGTTPVVSTKQFLRCSYCKVISAGSTQTNQGEITGTRTGTPAIKFFQMPLQTSITYVAAYTIPSGFTGFLIGWYAYTNRGSGNQFDREADIVFTTTDNVKNVKYKSEAIAITNNSPLMHDYTLKPFPIPEKTDCVLTCTAVSQADSDITAGFDIILIPNDMLQ